MKTLITIAISIIVIIIAILGIVSILYNHAELTELRWFYGKKMKKF